MANVTIGDLNKVQNISDSDLMEVETSTRSGSVDVGQLKQHIVADVEAELTNKVDKVAGKGLSTEDYTSDEKAKLADLENYDDTDLVSALENKVDKVAGKGLSSADFTADEKAKLADLENYDDTAINNRLDDVDNALDTKVDKVSGKQLSDENFTTSEKSKLAGLENYDDSEVRGLIDGKVDKVEGKQLSDENFTADEKSKLAGLENYDDADVRSELSNKVDKVAGKQLSDENFTSDEKAKLALIENYDDSEVRGIIDGKVDKVAGKGLSTNDLTDPLYDKLVGLEGTHWRGTFPSLAALQEGVTDPKAGDYADADVAGEDVQRYIWDATDNKWVVQSGGVAPITAAQVKMLYESNPDTNAFTDSEKDKLEGIADGATANSTDAYLLNRANHTGVQEIGTIAGLEDSLNSKADQTSLDAVASSKVDKVAGKGLSDENYTLAEKNKLDGIEAGAQVNSVTSVAGKTGDVTLVKADVGLGNVDNTSDANKPISTATAAALDGKVDKVIGKQLSTEDYTTAEKNKLDGIEAGAQVNVDTNIGQGSRTSTTIPLTSSTGTGTVLPSATTSLAGLQSAADKAKLDGIEAGATANATDAQLRDRSTHTGVQPIASVEGLQDALDDKVDSTDPRMTNSREWTASAVSQSEAEEGISTTARKWTAQRVRQAILGWWNASTFKTKLDGIETGATKNATDAQLRDRSTHTGTQPISSVTNLQSSLDSKVDKVAGYGLSQENYTSDEKAKLASIEGSKFKGEYVSLAALIAAHPSPEVGSYAYVDLGVGEVVRKYIWDSSDEEWVKQQGESAALTPAEIKSLYEGNPDTNAFTDSEKDKLSGIQAGATANATNAQLRDRSTHTGTQAISTVSGLQTALDNKVDDDDVRLTNARDWTASTVTQAEAEAGTASTARKWTAQRVRQAILGWWNGSPDKAKLDGIESGAQVNSVTSVAGKTGDVVLTHSDVNAAPASHTHPLSQITGVGDLASLSTNASTSNFLRGDGTWATPPNTTYTEITTAEIDAGTASTSRTISGRRMKYALDKKADVSHTHPLSHIADAGDVAGINTNGSTANFLRGDGTWATPPNTNTTYSAGTGITLTGTTFSLADERFTSALSSKLAGIAAGATANSTDAQLRDRSTHTGIQAMSTVDGLEAALGEKVDTTDSRLSNSREWTAAVVTQAEAEAGAATTARKWTAQRVRQAILGWWNSSTEKAKLDGIATGATKNATDAQLRDRSTHTGVQPISSVDGLQSAIDGKVDNDDARLTNARDWTASAVSQSEAEAGTATTARKWTAQRVRQAILGWWNSSAEKTKLDGIATGATKNATDAQLRDRSTHTGTQAISTVSGLQTALDSKVDKVTGMGLSQENFTTAEKNKLASLESSKFKGQFSSFAALQSAFPTADVGSYAYVDQGAGQDVVKYIWDSSDTKWVLQQGESAALTPSDVKSLYESNADTNAFTNSEKSKLAGIESGAQVNVGTNLAMGGSGNSRTITSSTGNNVSVPVATTSAAGFMSTNDKTKLDGLSNVNLIAGSNVSLSGAYPNITISSTNTTYSEIPESEVTAGTASTARAISARRLKFAIDTHGLKIGTTSTTAKAGNWTPTWSEVSGKPSTFAPSAHTHSLSEITDAGTVASLNTNGSTANFLRGDGTWVTPPNTTYTEITTAEIDAGTATTLRAISGRRMKYALDKKVDTSTQVIAGTGLSGGGTLAASRTLSVTYGTTAGTAAQGNDSRLSDSREWTASTVSQAEAEAGTATTRRAWTAQRVRQAITSWWNGVTSSWGRGLVSSADASAGRSALGLGTAATLDSGFTGGLVATSAKTAERVSYTGTASEPTVKYSFGGSTGGWARGIMTANLADDTQKYGGFWFGLLGSASNYTRGVIGFGNDTNWWQTAHQISLYENEDPTVGTSNTIFHKGNILKGTGTDDNFPMSQKAVTDALATKANTSTQVIAGTGLSGGGTLAANRTLSVKFGTTAGTAKEGNWMPTWSNVTGKPTTFTPSPHTHSLSEITDAGSVAALNTNGSTSNFLRGDGTWATPTNTTYSEITTAEIDAGTASTARAISGRRMKYALDKKADVSHTHALSQITGAGNVAGINTNGSTANYLRGDGTWVTPPNTTYSVMSVAEGTAGTATSSRTMRADYLKQIVNNHIDSAKVANNADTTQGKIITTGYLDLGNTDKQWWPKATSVFELLNGPDRTVWVEAGTLDAPAPDFVGFIKVERGPNLGTGYGFLRATGSFSNEEYIYSKTPLGVSGWKKDLIYEIGEWVDLRPYLLSPYYFSSHRDGGNYPPSVRLMPDGEVQMRGVVDFTTTSGVPNGPAFRVPEPFRPLMTQGGVCFSDAEPLWFGTSTWLVSGENNYSGLSNFAQGNVSIINNSMPAGTTTGSIEISGIRYFKY